ncbi:MAG: hypothetical protein II525_03330 [Bacteroidales bacterium]|nr:hypothetical protein [Bacteroidales bacterium]
MNLKFSAHVQKTVFQDSASAVAVGRFGIRVDLLRREGNTPARSIHLLRNSGHPFRSPWFALDETADRLRFSVFRFKPEELRHF